MRRVRHGDAARRVLALHQPFLQCGNSGSGGEPWRRRKPALHLWRRNEKDVPDPRFSLFGFSSRRNSCSGRAFALHPFTLQNERRIDHGDFFPSSRLRVPEARTLRLRASVARTFGRLFFVLRCCFSFPVPSCSTTRCRIRRPQTREAGPGWGRGVLAAEVLSGVRCAKRGESQAGISLRESGGGAVRVRR